MDLVALLLTGFRGMIGPEAAIYALAAIGLNVHFGYTGLLNFGQVGFMLVGAYGVAMGVTTFGWSLWAGLLLGIISAVVLALILGIPTLRLRGDYLAIATIAAGEVLRYFYRSTWSEKYTGGVYGLPKFADPFYELNPLPQDRQRIQLLQVSSGAAPGSRPRYLFDFSVNDTWVMIVSWLLVLLVCVMLLLLMRSPWGRVLRSIREDELAARSLGKNVYSYKMQSLILGGVFGALAGALMAIRSQSVHPDTYDPKVTFYLYAIMILGGAARIFGPVVGSVIFWFIISFFDAALRSGSNAGYIPEWLLTASDAGAARLALVGLGLVLLMVYRPAGIMGNREEMRLETL